MQKHILLVDDESGTCFALGNALISCGYRVSVAMNGKDGLEIIRRSISSGDKIDLAIIDIQLPGMSGSILIGKLKSENIPVPVFVVSGTLDKRFLINLLNIGGPVSFERTWPGRHCKQRDDAPIERCEKGGSCGYGN
jgi:DNA-binding response OmpR family regulator